MKQNLLNQIGILLLNKGFVVKTIKGCFDVIARQGSNIVLIKVLEDANSISTEFADEMKKIASCMDASPLIIASKAQLQLQENVVYTRHGIYTLNVDTFKNVIDEKSPFLKSNHAGLTATVAGDKLKKAREKEDISLNSLSKKICVSKSMITRYENDGSEVIVNRAVKIYDIFGDDVFEKIDIFSREYDFKAEPKSQISKKFDELGFNAADTFKVPFNVVAKKNEEIILTEIGDKADPQMMSLSRLVDADNLVIFKKKKPKDIPSLKKEEFFEFERAKELIKFLREF
jgi:predicted transcriptional regulator